MKGDQGLTGSPGEPGLEGQSCNCTTSVRSAFLLGRNSALLVTSDSETIDFETTFYDVGNDVSSQSGVFKCRIPGLYYFSFSFRSYPHGSYGMRVDLLLNFEQMASIYMDAFSKHNIQTRSVVLFLEQGDEVWLRANPNTYINGWDKANQFMGYLIQPY